MALIVQKFGGTSLANPERINAVAERVAKYHKEGNQIIVVVSAMSGETNKLVSLAEEMMEDPDPRELDMVVSSGEQVTAGLTALALINMGLKAKSYAGHQIKILTDEAYGKARILNIDSNKIQDDLKAGFIVVVAGFQGVDSDGNITTLGRGGSDTTAVAVAAALKADECQIYTDVDGIYTTDPRVVPEARKLKSITFEEMLEMASLGAKVMQSSSVQKAMINDVDIYVKSTFSNNSGTKIGSQDKVSYDKVITGVAYSSDDAKVTLQGVKDKPGVASSIFKPLYENNIVVDMIVQNVSADNSKTDVTFTIKRDDLQKTTLVLEKLKEQLNFDKLLTDNHVSKISIVGAGMITHPGVAYRMFDALSSKKINIMVISTSEIKISVLIDEKNTKEAVKTIHQIFELDK